MLQQCSTADHNRMLGTRIPHPKSTNYEGDENSSPRLVKRLRREETGDTSDIDSIAASPLLRPKDDEYGVAEHALDDAGIPQSSQTDLETALPPVKTDQEAIDEYEAYRAGQAEELGDAKDRLSKSKWVRGKSSIYVDAFNLALDTVLEDEKHLFDETELALFEFWKQLNYEAQYLYVRLFLRKTAAWHRIGTLGYHSDIADLELAITTLREKRCLPESSTELQRNPGELEPPKGTTLGADFTFADISEDHITTLEEASSLLRLDELKVLAKDAKVQGKTKAELLKAFRRMSNKQTGIGWTTLRRVDSSGSVESANPHSGPDEDDATSVSGQNEVTNRDSFFVQKILDETGPCIRLSLAPLKLFERVHLVFYRSTEWTEKSLTTIILARIARRNFPEYIVSRSANIFASRSLVVEFEASLRTQFKIDNILEFNGKPTDEGLQHILDLCDEVYPRWKILLAEEQHKEDSIYQSGEGAYLRRLSPAWVYTRILHKGAYVYGKLKHHKREHELLTELLGQRLFHTSRRGDWYQRKALLEEHYMAALSSSTGQADEAARKHWKRIALQTCEVGLEDPLVHIIHHYDLQKRVKKLEKALKVAKRAQHDFSHVRLVAPVEVEITGVRIEKDTVETTSNGSGRRNSSPHPTRRGQKTIWLDPAEGNGECSVEAMCLSNYRLQGWKGYHSEGGIVRTLFAYLFYDILFEYVPNVFQTPFQTCPLDLHTDAFYPSRLSEINHRLIKIGNGGAGEIIRSIWDEHHERKTCVVGLDWSFELSDLLEIAECFDGEALGTVCKVMAQEYGQRGGGMPDLFLWRMDGKGGKGEVKIAEVKSENDRLMDTQRLWIHVLTGAGVGVELCHAVAEEVRRLA
ncbi:hypothetical protein NA57DRAFT_42307 [Rhizodiscina lignyota]|uniref:Fanconi-associated nuclease n=1 Tax=Rhizodiscina lignyota TaxID=1504668 RepID=A0A9P4IC01_9PEZI|nr:hypothetical protein NA57DRAFT_42307 [Rhizodiscina lignyota]